MLLSPKSDIARDLLGIKIPISKIAAATNLSRKEIEKLRRRFCL
jgi:hypothetical protein